ncbi:hypothetical protein NB688_004199 [Xanthomonas sacchari]|uniref:Uncharacterized protein n=1 Tax=Xanthomonas sacchari TaxID=56458 RepID=A0ABT3E1Z9_9XANT|nr:hypothetical protein [Xanthomonas sacchari]MCW0422033.1 hypothetical protein [Xanthomonas sacchari]
MRLAGPGGRRIAVNWGIARRSQGIPPVARPGMEDASVRRCRDRCKPRPYASGGVASRRWNDERQTADRCDFFRVRTAARAARRPRKRRLHPLHPDPGADPAGGPSRPRRGRPGPDRYRQDPGVPGGGDEPPAQPPGAGRPQAGGSARADPGPDPRAGDPDPQGRGQVRLRTGPALRPGLRRRGLRQAARTAAAGRGRDHRHPRPPDRLRQAAQGGVAARLRDLRARRSRPHVRPGLHQGHPLPAAAHARARYPPDPAVLGHPQPPRAGAGLRAHERAGKARRRDREHHRRARAPAHLLPLRRGEADPAAGPAVAQRGCADHGVRQHQGVRRARGAGAGAQRLPGRRAVRRRAAEKARDPAQPLPEGSAGDPGGHRRGRARPAHRRGQVRLQLRPAVRRRGLRAPHRPHRAAGRGGRRDQLRLRALRDEPAGHRGLHRAEDPGRAGHRRAAGGAAAHPARTGGGRGR